MDKFVIQKKFSLLTWIVVGISISIMLFLLGIVVKDIFLVLLEDGFIILDLEQSWIFVFFLTFFLGVVILIFIGNSTNKAVIGPDEILVKQGIRGKKYTFPKENIYCKSVNHNVSNRSFPKVKENHYINLLLKNGKVVLITSMFGDWSQWSKIYDAIECDECNDKSQFRKIKKMLIEEHTNETFYEVERRPWLSVFFLSWFVISLIVLLMLVTGINQKIGPQYDFEIDGTIKVLHEDIEDGKKVYKFALDYDDDMDYSGEVSSSFYKRLSVGDEVLIKGTKGCLGITYNLVLITNNKER